MTRHLAMLAVAASLGLSACGPSTQTVTLPVIDPNMPGAQACKAAIARTARQPVEAVTIGETTPLAGGTQVTATIAGYKGSWTCIGAANGAVSGVAYRK